MNKKLSIIILTYNSERDIYDCLQSVYRYNDIGEALEIIIVDNNSKCFDTMQSKLKEEYPEVIVIPNANNGGYGYGNNIGINASTAPIVAIMNPDVRLIMPVFGTMLKTLEDENVIMCGGKQYANYDKAALSYYYDHNAPAILQSIGYLIHSKLDKYDYRRMWLSGAFFVIKKAYFLQIGLFDERIFMYAEEFDIHTRLRRAFPHKKMIYLPQLKYLHLIENRPITYESAYKTYRSDIHVCRLLGCSPYLCIIRKKIALRINMLIGTILSILHGTSVDYSHYRTMMSALTQLSNEYKHTNNSSDGISANK